MSRTLFEFGHTQINKSTPVDSDVELNSPNLIQIEPKQIELLYSWHYSRYSAPIHWLDHDHMTSNNETVSRQMP